MRRFLNKALRSLRAFGARPTAATVVGFLRYQYSRISKKPLVRMRVHSFEMLLDPSDPGISRELIIHGGREQQLREIIADAVADGDAVVDVGANIGYYSLFLAQLVGPSGRVYALEPAPSNFELLRVNVDLNGFGSERVELFRCAASEANGTERLYLAKQSNLHAIPTRSLPANQGTHAMTDAYVEVDAVRLSDFIKGKRPIALIRMDVEGHEVEILRGLRESIAEGAFRGKICFEVHTPRYGPGTRDIRKELEFLFVHGYSATVVTSAQERGNALTARGYRPYRVVRTHVDRERGLYRNLAHPDLLELVGEVGGIRDVLLERPVSGV